MITAIVHIIMIIQEIKYHEYKHILQLDKEVADLSEDISEESLPNPFYYLSFKMLTLKSLSLLPPWS